MITTNIAMDKIKQKIVIFMKAFLSDWSLFRSLVWVSFSFVAAIIFSDIESQLTVLVNLFFMDSYSILKIFNTGIPYALVIAAMIDASLKNGKIEILPFVSIRVMIVVMILIFIISALLYSFSNSHVEVSEYSLANIVALFSVFMVLLVYIKWISFCQFDTTQTGVKIYV